MASFHRPLEISCCSAKAVTGSMSYRKKIEVLVRRGADGSLSSLWNDNHYPSGKSWNPNCKIKTSSTAKICEKMLAALRIQNKFYMYCLRHIPSCIYWSKLDPFPSPKATNLNSDLTFLWAYQPNSWHNWVLNSLGTIALHSILNKH